MGSVAPANWRRFLWGLVTRDPHNEEWGGSRQALTSVMTHLRFFKLACKALWQFWATCRKSHSSSPSEPPATLYCWFSRVIPHVSLLSCSGWPYTPGVYTSTIVSFPPSTIFFFLSVTYQVQLMLLTGIHGSIGNPPVATYLPKNCSFLKRQSTAPWSPLFI